jgi:hypothetical protein
VAGRPDVRALTNQWLKTPGAEMAIGRVVREQRFLKRLKSSHAEKPTEGTATAIGSSQEWVSAQADMILIFIKGWLFTRDPDLLDHPTAKGILDEAVRIKKEEMNARKSRRT